MPFRITQLARHALRIFIASSVVLGLASPAAQAARPYPDKPVQFVVPFGAGGITDLIARTYGDWLAGALGQPVVVENKAGGGGSIAANAVLRSAADGYTLLLGTNVTHSINPQFLKAVKYDPLSDFQAVALIGLNGNVLLVNNDMPVKTFAEFIEYVKARPGALNYASTSIGSSAHLATELLKQHVKGLDYMHIPFNGLDGLTALMGGNVDFMFVNIGSAISQIHAGKVRAIAVTTLERTSELPAVPTIAESGVPGFEVLGWAGVFVPKATPMSIVTQLNESINQAHDDPKIRAMFETTGLIPMSGTPQQASQFVREEYEKWGKVLRNAGIQQQ